MFVRVFGLSSSTHHANCHMLQMAEFKKMLFAPVPHFVWAEFAEWRICLKVVVKKGFYFIFTKKNSSRFSQRCLVWTPVTFYIRETSTNFFFSFPCWGEKIMTVFFWLSRSCKILLSAEGFAHFILKPPAPSLSPVRSDETRHTLVVGEHLFSFVAN